MFCVCLYDGHRTSALQMAGRYFGDDKSMSRIDIELWLYFNMFLPGLRFKPQVVATLHS